LQVSFANQCRRRALFTRRLREFVVFGGKGSLLLRSRFQIRGYAVAVFGLRRMHGFTTGLTTVGPTEIFVLDRRIPASEVEGWPSQPSAVREDGQYRGAHLRRVNGQHQHIARLDPFDGVQGRFHFAHSKPQGRLRHPRLQ